MKHDWMTALEHSLATRERRSFPGEGLRDAGVLVPLLERDGSWRLLLTERSALLRVHSGQISFPGGKMDASDPDLIATALRETHEELGVHPGGVRVLGMLDDVPTPSGYRITPVVGAIELPPAAYVPNAEVAYAFEVSLARLRDPSAFHDEGIVEFQGNPVSLYAYRVEQWRIWGATARMIRNLLEVLDPAVV